MPEIPATQRRAPAKPLEHYACLHRRRDEAIAAAYRSGGYSMKAIGDHFGLHYSMVSRIVNAANRCAFECLQAIPRWHTQILQVARDFKLPELAARDGLDIDEASDPFASARASVSAH